MVPYLRVNDFIVIKESEEYNVGDVVTYINESESYVTHRIISIDEGQVVTKGDANNIQDEPFDYSNIVGKVVFRVRGLGFIMYLFNSYISWILLFLIGLGITMIIPDKEDNDEERRDSDGNKEDYKDNSEENNNKEDDNNSKEVKKRSSKKTTKTSSKKASTRRSSSTTSRSKAKKTLKKEVYCIPLFVCTILHFVL